MMTEPSEDATVMVAGMPGRARLRRPGKRVLVVDDDERTCTLWAELLDDPSRQIIQACDGEEALEVVRSTKLDLVVTDMYMPGMTGLSLLEEARQICPELPFLVVTGTPDCQTAVECIKKGAQDYLEKANAAGRLAPMVEALLDGQAAQEPGTLIHDSRMAPPQLAGYDVIRPIGAGSMGVVSLVEKADEDGITRQYAMKTLKPPPEEFMKAEILERFRREARIAHNLSHPNIVRITDYGVEDTHRTPYLVMEYVRGGCVRDLIVDQKPLSYQQKVRILRQVASALAEIHKAGICHRDIKPSNILLDEQGNAKLTDFGIARLSDSELTRTGSSVGTPAYMSPESLGNPRVDHRADIFSLGAVAYEFLVGERPFQGDSVAAICYAVCRERPMEPRRIDAGFPMPLQRILGRMLAKSPDERYQSCDLLISELDAFLAMDETATQVRPGSSHWAVEGAWRLLAWCGRPFGMGSAFGNRRSGAPGDPRHAGDRDENPTGLECITQAATELATAM